MKTESSAAATSGGNNSNNNNNNNNSSSTGHKPNAWSKPLQGAVPVVSSSTSGSTNNSSNTPTTHTGTTHKSSQVSSKGGGGGSSGSGGTSTASGTTTASTNHSFNSSHRSNSTGSGGYSHNHHHHHKSHHNRNHSGAGYHSTNNHNHSKQTTPSSTNNSSSSSAKPNTSFQVEKTLPALRERFLHLLITLTGQKVSVTLNNGTIYTGILHTATPFLNLPPSQRFKYVLRAVTVSGGGANHNHHINNNNSTNGVSSSANGSHTNDPVVKPGSTVVLDMEQVVQLHCKACRLDALAVASNKAGGAATSANGDSFTDTEISRANHHPVGGGTNHNSSNNSSSNNTVRTKDLVAVDSVWTSAGDGAALQPLTPINSKAAKLAGLSSGASMTPQPPSSGLSGSIAGWDQFKANEELFNVKSSYDENVYTTKLDPSQISAQARYRAEQLAREIETTTTTNIHLAEERGQVSSQDFADYDEEDRYSGVLKTKDLLKSSAKAPAPPKLNYAQAVSKVEGPNNSAPPGFTTTSTAVATDTTTEKAKIQSSDSGEPASVVEVMKPNAISSVTEKSEAKNHIENEAPEASKSKITEKEESNSSALTQQTLVESEVKKDDTVANATATSATTSESSTKEPTVKSSLSATAKSFSLNINAKTFQPTPPPPTSIPPPPPPTSIPPQHHHQQQQQHHIPQPQYMYDPATGLPVMLPQHMMPGGKYYIIKSLTMLW